MKINIVMISDDNYVTPTMVAIRSLIANRLKHTRLNICVLGVNLSKYNVANLKNMNIFRKTKISVMDASDIIHDYQNIDQNRHVTPAALLKFWLPKIFNNYDKILYLDSDIIVQNDLCGIYNTDISNQYGAVIKDTLGLLNREYMESVHINNEFYFNSGVMLLNLAKMRQDDITNKLIQYCISVEQNFMDQDAFNAIIGHNVKFLSWKYNFLNYYMTVLNNKQMSEFFQDNFFKPFWQIYDGAVILHLGGKEKPWNQDMGYLSEIWKKYYDLLCNSRSDLKLFYKTTSAGGRRHIYCKGYKIASYKKILKISDFPGGIEDLQDKTIPKYEYELKDWFLKSTGNTLNLSNPITFNEKMQWLKLYNSVPMKTRLADKFLVRKYVAKQIGEKYLTPLLGVYNSFDDIDFDNLPNQFVIKCNHGSGWNLIVSDKSKLDKNDTKQKIDDWMSKNYAFNLGYELHYLNIKPKIMIEKYLDPKNSKYEIQLWTFNGEIKFVSIETIKDSTELYRGLFYPDGTPCEFQISPNHYKQLNDIPSIKLFNRAIKIGKKLLIKTPYVRIDFVINNKDILFREMTFTSGSGLSKIVPEKYNNVLGDWIKLPTKKYIL